MDLSSRDRPTLTASVEEGVRYTSLTTTISHDNNNHRTSKHASKSWRSDGLPGWEHHTGGSRSKPTVHPCPHRWGGCGLFTNSTTQRMSPRKRNTITTLSQLYARIHSHEKISRDLHFIPSECCLVSRHSVSVRQNSSRNPPSPGVRDTLKCELGKKEV